MTFIHGLPWLHCVETCCQQLRTWFAWWFLPRWQGELSLLAIWITHRKPTRSVYLGTSSATSIHILARVMRKRTFLELPMSTKRRLIQKFDISSSMMRGWQCCTVAPSIVKEVKFSYGLDPRLELSLPLVLGHFHASVWVCLGCMTLGSPVLGFLHGPHN